MPDLRYKGPARHNLLTATGAINRLTAREITSEALTADCLARIKARDQAIGAWVYIDPDYAMGQARLRDRAPPKGALHGIPVGIKDILDTRDMPTGHGSSIYKGEQTPGDSACVAALRRAGAIILGKTTTTEFASPWPIGVKNPHDLTRTPGVSSSGSAAAVADFMVPLAIGTQTGGSVIRPATYCGVYGYKATIDGLDRGGIRHVRPSLDTLGLFARSLPDIGLMRRAITGLQTEMTKWPKERTPRFGLCRTHQWSQAKPETQAAIELAAAKLRAAGATVSEIELPDIFARALESFWYISMTEGARALESEFRDHLETMNPWLKDVAAKAPSITPQQYEAALALATECRAHLAQVFQGVDALLTPAAAGEPSQNLTGLEDQTFCPLWTLMHGPAITMPAFTGPAGMPMGLQLVGGLHADDRLIALSAWAADALEPIPIAVKSAAAPAVEAGEAEETGSEAAAE